MKNYPLLIFCMFVASLHADVVIPGELQAAKTEKSTTSPLPQVAAQHAASSSYVLLIEAPARAKDIKAAFDFLKNQRNQKQITLELKDKTVYSNILDLDVLSGGTMLTLRINTTKGITFHTVAIENVAALHI